MIKTKKFGTFGGVFTPSILTILGVIMYLRFPAIIGQAGLINTIGIIIIAHIISVTTSLSVASLSTDKPVQTGGTYFMISRSLGLTIGGTLGLALFVGLSFSVSLYLIGFAESFLQYWDLEFNINTIRLTGTIILVVVTTITFISTSLAIKTQYFIMAAIGLSLLSIFLGNHDFAPTEVNLAPLATSAPFMILFGIFFPAVTGFEAGVSMSGDLKNPKKALPVGAVLAVGIGFIVYIGLAFFYAYTVDASALLNDPQILFKISLVPALVIAGIWGATLSSAFGSILGAPRILQAIAMDKIAPKFLAKGTGQTNEPRNALLIAFLIAEAGILIGELDVIARIVSMFFITTYAFLNLASAIESWSSSDFRPAFKIPRFVSILGASSAFIVMILLDFLALAGATVVLGLLYFYLQRKELILEGGDAWNGFWTNMAKRSLLRLNATKDNKRNWRPNIILFSGGEKARPHLIEMGLSLTGKLGALTDFTLLCGDPIAESKQPDVTNKQRQIPNYFIRQLSCDTVINGIKAVTNVYGFSGFEPNTVLMGWSHNAHSAGFLKEIIKDIRSKNLNAVFLDYDQVKGFGKKETIDIWWKGKGRHLSFALSIVKFLQSDHSWRDARIRILIINKDTSIAESLYRNTSSLLSEHRIYSDIKILNDDFGSRTKEEIILSESASTDLILLGLSQSGQVLTNDPIEAINQITGISGSLLILSPSDEFDEINIIERIHAPIRFTTDEQPMPELSFAANKVIWDRLEKLDSDFRNLGDFFIEKVISEIGANLRAIINPFKDYAEQNGLTLKKKIHEYGSDEIAKIVSRNHQTFLWKITHIIENQNQETLHTIQEILTHGISAYLDRLERYVGETPDSIHVPYFITSKNREKNYKIHYHKMITFFFRTLIIPVFKKQMVLLEEVSIELLLGIRKILFGINDAYEQLFLSDEANLQINLDAVSLCNDEFRNVEQTVVNLENQIKSAINTIFRVSVNQLAVDLQNQANLRQAGRKYKIKKDDSIEYLNAFAENWGSGMLLLNRALFLDALVLSRKITVKNLFQNGNERIHGLITQKVITPIDQLRKNITSAAENPSTAMQSPVFPENLSIQNIFKEALKNTSDVIDNFSKELTLPAAIYRDSKPLLLAEYGPVSVNVYKSAAYYTNTLFFEPFYRELEQLEQTVRHAIVECKEVNSMLLFWVNNVENSPEQPETGRPEETVFYDKLIKQVIEEKTKVEKTLEAVPKNAFLHLHESFSKLFYHSVLDSEKNIYYEKREQTRKRFSTGFLSSFLKIQNLASNLIVQLLNSASSGVILSKKYLSVKGERKAQIRQVVDLVDKLLPDSKKYKQIPVFYRNLFSSGSKITDELWVPRPIEFNLIRNAYRQHKEGRGGAVLIKGVHGAGKTAITRNAARHLFKPNNVFWITPPTSGTTHAADFLTALQKQVGRQEDFYDIFNHMPYESAVVINDLELWWERRAAGGAVIENLLELIDRYGKKTFFIINCNRYSFNLMKHLFPLEDNFISIIDCEPFNVKELQDLILKRHKSSGLTLNYKNKPESSLTQLSLSFLFNSYFNFSEGIPGIAMNAWKANIVSASEDSIIIQKPVKPDADFLHFLQPDWLITIELFIQHKVMDADKLSRITGYEKRKSEKLIMNLINSGIAVPITENAYSLGRNIEPLLVDVCLTKGLI